MTALAADYNAPLRGDIEHQLDFPVAAATTIYEGALVALDTARNAVPAADTAGLVVVGRCAKQVANAGAAGAKRVTVDCGIFRYGLGAAPPLAAHIGSPAYVQDDNLVSIRGPQGVVAGIIVDVDAAGAWIEIDPIKGAGNAGREVIAAAGALSPLLNTTELTVSGTKAYTLANGVFHGQRKRIVSIAPVSTPAGTVTPATPQGWSSVLFGTTNGGFIELEWRNTASAIGWYVAGAAGCTVT